MWYRRPPRRRPSVKLPGHEYALSKLEAEQQLHRLTHSDTELVVARIAQVYSADSLSIRRFPQLAATVPGHNRTHFVHREDVVRVLTALMYPENAPGIYNVADDHPLTVQEAASLIQEATGDAEAVAAHGPIAPMLRRIMEATLVLDTHKIKAIGFVPKYPSLEAGLHHEI